jgi:hypothetical protein
LVYTDKTGSGEDLLVANPNHALRLASGAEGPISSEDEDDDDTPPESASEGDEKLELLSSDDDNNAFKT